MKFHYYSETDSLYIDFVDKPGVETREIEEGVILDFDEKGHLVGLDIDHASKVVNLSRLEIESLPVESVALAKS